MLKHYKITETRTQRFLALMLAGAIALLAGGAPAAADETYVVDDDAGTGFNGALFLVDPISGNRALVSDFGNAAQGPVGEDPRGLAPEPGGTVLVIDLNAGTGGFGALFRVDPASGDRSLVSDFGNRAQGPLGAVPVGLVLEAAGTVLVIDKDSGTGFSGVLFRVDAISGNRSLVSDFGNAAQGPLVDAPRGLALEASGTVLVIDEDAGTGARGALYRVDAISGSRSQVSDFGNATQGALGIEPIGLVLEAGGSVLVIDEDVGTGFLGALFRVDAASGVRTVVSDFGVAFQGPLGTNLRGLALEAAGTALVIDEQAGTGGLGMLFAVDQISGLRVQVSDFGSVAQGVLGNDPYGVAVVVPDTTPPETGIDNRPPDPDTQTTATFHFSGTDDASPPAALGFECELDGGGFSGCTSPKTYTGLGLGAHGFRVRARDAAGQVDLTPASHTWTVATGPSAAAPRCFGRPATLVGTAGNDILRGTAGNDVIVGLAGHDRIDGRGGSDRICAGPGRDTLRGGPGSDRLDGGPGTDVLDGGQGRDRCVTGEVTRSCP